MGMIDPIGIWRFHFPQLYITFFTQKALWCLSFTPMGANRS
jgi:hypothetical protein